MTLRSAFGVVVATAVACVALAACGSDGRAANGTVAPTSDAATSTTSTAPITATPSPAAPTTVMTTTTTSPPVFDFPTADAAEGWRVTNDTVMGGVSIGELAWTAGALVFAGELSLANNGGFASIRSPEIDPQRALDWAGSAGPRMQVDGDGRTWTVEVRTDDESGGWISSFPTSPDGLTDVVLPWASFMPVNRFLDPRVTDETLDPARIERLAFYLVDGIEGPFRLGVRSIASPTP
ncbi:MAG: CIA30 family protein [Ilumatobacteraceae bacterium]